MVMETRHAAEASRTPRELCSSIRTDNASTPDRRTCIRNAADAFDAFRGTSFVNHPRPAREHLVAGESLRGIAIVLVFCYHFLGTLCGYGPNPHANWGNALFYGGSIGVDLFFVLSGFLLSLPYFRGSPLEPRRYAMNRALRILPMYYAVILCAALWTGRWDAAWQAALFQDPPPGSLSSFSLVWWSLVVEMQFYLVLPFAVWLARSVPGRWVLGAVLLILAGCYLKIASPQAPTAWAAWRNSLLGRWPEFAAGILAAWVHSRFDVRLRSLDARRRRWLGSVLAIGALVAIDALMLHGLHTFGFLQFKFWYASFACVSALWAVFLIAVIDLQPVMLRVFVNPVLHRIGDWSYSIYLLHSVGMVYIFMHLGIAASDRQLDHVGRNILLFVGLSTAILLVSALTHRWIERPFLRLKHGRFLHIGRIREDAM